MPQFATLHPGSCGILWLLPLAESEEALPFANLESEEGLPFAKRECRSKMPAVSLFNGERLDIPALGSGWVRAKLGLLEQEFDRPLEPLCGG